MAGPIRRLIQRAPVRNAVRRLVGLPEIAGRSSALTPSRTTSNGRLLRENAQPLFRSIGDRSARADLRNVKPQELPAAKPQADADAPDTEPQRVYQANDPSVLNRMESARASDNAQKTDLDAPPRTLRGVDVTDKLVSQVGLGPGLKNSVEVQVQPSPQATQVRAAREQDMARAAQKRRVSEGLKKMPDASQEAGVADSAPSKAALTSTLNASATTQGSKASSVAQKSEPADEQPQVRVAVTDWNAMADAHMQRANAAYARAEALARHPNFNSDQTGRMQADYYRLQSMAFTHEQAAAQHMANAQREQAFERKAAEDRNYKREELAANERAVKAQHPDDTMTANMEDLARASAQFGPKAAAGYQTDLYFKGTPTARTDPSYIAARQNFELTTSGAALSHRIRSRDIPRPGDPLVSEIAQIVTEAHPNDAKEQAKALTQIINNAVSSSQLTGDVRVRLAQLLQQVIQGAIGAQ